MNSNKSLFYVGLAIIGVAVVLLLGNFLGDSSFPTALGFLGVISIAASNYRLLK